LFHPKKPLQNYHAMKRKIIFPVVLLLLVLLAFGLSRGTQWNCWQIDFDMNSGRLRATRHILWFNGEQRFEESALSTAIQNGNPDTNSPLSPDWRPMARRSPGDSPSSKNWSNGFLNNIDQVGGIWRLADFAPEAKREIALRILQNVKQSGWSGLDRRYMEALQELAETAGMQRRKISERDIQNFHNSI
jgi:hypothetical protein